jgi:hypothetical protein
MYYRGFPESFMTLARGALKDEKCSHIPIRNKGDRDSEWVMIFIAMTTNSAGC